MTVQLFYSLYQVKQLIFSSGFLLTKELKTPNLPCINKRIRGHLFLSQPFHLYDQFTTITVGNTSFGDCLIIVTLSVSETSICVDSILFYFHIRNHDQVDSLLDTTTLLNTDQGAPDLLISFPLGLIASNTSQLRLINTYMFNFSLQYNILVNNNNHSLMYQVYPGLRYVDLSMS